MIALTRTTGEGCSLDPTAIERIEAVPETIVLLRDGARYIVTESPAQVIGKVRDFRARAKVSTWRLVDTVTSRAEVTGAAIVPHLRTVRR